MNHLKTFLLATGAAAIAASSAMAMGPGPYVGLGAGIHMPRDSSVLIGGAAREIEFENGPIVLGTFGYKWDQGTRLEFELGYREGDVGNVIGPGTTTTAWTGSQKSWSTMGNVLYDFGTGPVTPYIGLGAGISWVGLKDNFRGPTTPAYDGTDSEFTWQGIAGLGFDASERFHMFLEYRYIGAGKGDYPAAVATPASAINDHKDRSHNVLVGFRYSFGGPREVVEETRTVQATPPPAPAPRTPPPAPAIPQKFLVFFDFDKSNLRNDAQTIVANAVDYAKRNGKARITATGHADTSGTPAYNLALSERRAQAVKAELRRLGIPENEVVVYFKGESEPLVATGDGVKEPQNRRVEIIME